MAYTSVDCVIAGASINRVFPATACELVIATIVISIVGIRIDVVSWTSCPFLKFGFDPLMVGEDQAMVSPARFAVV